MSYQQNSSRLRRLPDFFGITDSSGLMPLSQIRDNGIINNGKAADHDRKEKKPSVLEQLRNQPVQERTHKTAPKKSAEREI